VGQADLAEDSGQADNRGVFGYPRLCTLVLLSFAPAFGQPTLPVEKLVEFIKSSVAQKLPDKEVSAYLTRVHLASKLDDRTVEDLQSLGAGPKTVAALNRLVEQSASLPVAKSAASAPKYVEPPPPSSGEQRKIINQVRTYALNYSRTLPDFICLQVTRRMVDDRQRDRLVEKLSYFDQKEKYELISRNDDSYYGKTWESAGGSISRGEFGSLLKEAFDPETDAGLRWDHWGTLRSRLCYVFRYQVDRIHSNYSVDYERKQQVTPGYHGLVYVEKDTNAIVRMTIEPDMPVEFPIQDIHQMVDYNYVDIGGNRFLLPLTSQVQSRTGRLVSRNEIEFRRYQKYSADANIRFDDAEDPAEPDKEGSKP
jgi:hypothetical protein